MKLIDFAEIVKGGIYGDPGTEICGVSGIMDAQKGDITFFSSAKYLKQAVVSKASCIIVREQVPEIMTAQLITPNPYFAFAKAIEVFYPAPSHHRGISDKAIISDRAQLGKDVSVYPFACLSDDISVGDNTVVMPGVFIGERSEVGKVGS